MGGERGRSISSADKGTALQLIQEARNTGSRLKPACSILFISVKTYQRWSKERGLQDKRCGPRTTPQHALTQEERAILLRTVNGVAYQDLSPRQIVPKLADQGIYIGSESTIYRILHQEKMMRSRRAERPKTHTKPREYKATAPNQLWSWDITYMASQVRGQYFYFYVFMDVFSRKIVGYNVHSEQSSAWAAAIVSEAYRAENITEKQVTLHTDNGSPMKGVAMLAMLQELGIAASFSRPSVSNDNAHSEALFKTCKYRPNYPSKPFASLDSAREWVKNFVHWYNTMHQHSEIQYVTPQQRHAGEDHNILEERKRLYVLQQQKNPRRWSRKTRNWNRLDEVHCNKRKVS